ncbi:MAG: class I SAM-dependent methyltransferase, partial [Desulfuromonadaceae bacterium]
MGQFAETSLGTRYDRIFQLIQKRVSDKLKLPIEIQLWGNRIYRLGKGDPAVKILVEDRQGLAALLKLDEVKICEAYMAGSLDVKGDMLGFASLRGLLRDHHPLHSLWQRIAPLFLGRVRTDREAIAGHYDFSNDFYLKFMDSTRCYSQAVFERDDETLATAQRRKLDFAIAACRLQPGDRVLDVGGGWGSFTEHAGRQGIQVTSLTISQQSETFLTDLIERLQLPCNVLNQDFWEHSAPDL